MFHTAGLTASAAVLALSIQAGSLNGDDETRRSTGTAMRPSSTRTPPAGDTVDP